MTRLINADALKATVMSKADGMEDLWDTAGVLNAINNAPTVDIDLAEYSDKLWKEAYERGKNERPQGKWIKGREISREMIYDKILHIDYENFTCSKCGLVLDNLLYHVDGSPFYNYCPSCGAQMREDGKQ